MAMVFYSEIDGEGREVSSKTIDPSKRPHFIFMGKHYRGDGTCRCDDITHVEMVEWGYVWNPLTHLWEAGEE